MRRIGNVAVTTTPTLEGWRIREYLGPVTAHVVVDGGLLRDLVAGLTDLLSTRSAGHSERLARLSQEAIDRVRSHVISEGGNVLVGLRVDLRELSARGRSMLLVTAGGTAAVAEPPADAVERPAAAPRGRGKSKRKATAAASGEAVRLEMHRRELVARIEGGETRLDESDWEFLVTHRVRDLGPRLLALVEEVLLREPDDSGRKRVIAAALDYFRVTRAEEAAEALYPALAGAEGLAYFALHAIEQLDLFDAARIRQLISAGEPEVGRRALQAVRAERRLYAPDDAEEIERLREAIPGVFPRLAELTEEKSLLSSEMRRVWLCAECGNKNVEMRERCTECGRDRYGFPGGFLDPEEAVTLLDRRLEALRACLGME